MIASSITTGCSGLDGVADSVTGSIGFSVNIVSVCIVISASFEEGDKSCRGLCFLCRFLAWLALAEEKHLPGGMLEVGRLDLFFLFHHGRMNIFLQIHNIPYRRSSCKASSYNSNEQVPEH